MAHHKVHLPAQTCGSVFIDLDLCYYVCLQLSRDQVPSALFLVLSYCLTLQGNIHSSQTFVTRPWLSYFSRWDDVWELLLCLRLSALSPSSVCKKGKIERSLVSFHHKKLDWKREKVTVSFSLLGLVKTLWRRPQSTHWSSFQMTGSFIIGL